MRKFTLGCLGIVCFLADAAVRIVPAAEPATGQAESNPAATELDRLGVEYQKLQREQLRALPPDGTKESDGDLSDEEWLRQGRALEAEHPGPDEIVLPRFLTLAKTHPESPLALDALAFAIMRGGYHTGDVEGEPWRIKEQAIDLVAQHHMADPRVVHVFRLLSGSLPSQKSEAFLRQTFENSPDRATRAAAGYSLARYLHNLGHVHARSKQIANQSRVANNERFWKLVVTPYLEEQFPYDEAKVSAEVERLLARVIDDYSDVPAADWKWTGPGKVCLQSEPYASPKTYGSLAKSLLFELKHLAPGDQAPEIEGTDAAGDRFRLSDYRGKVVLLTFSADWCGGCVELYPLERKLVEKFRDRPFVLLSVSMDETIETLKAATAAGAITWRCWWDGLHGPIHAVWNPPGAPTIYLLDQQGIIQDVRFNRATPPEEFERAIARLLPKTAAKDLPSR
jgi:thiol-disulfide isomerase/thioredoxin